MANFFKCKILFLCFCTSYEQHWNTHSLTWSFLISSGIMCVDPDPVPQTYRYDVPRPSDEFFSGAVIMYKCGAGKWFGKDIYKIAITCRDDAQWYPHPTTIYCKGSCFHMDMVKVNNHTMWLKIVIYIHNIYVCIYCFTHW